jgi:glycosyltransferase involved in cell wall biosynthesis
MYLAKTITGIRNIGFVSTRFSGIDGVSLETAKWAEVLGRMGYSSFYFSGLSDRDENCSMVVPEAFFDHPDIRRVQERCFGSIERSEILTGEIHRLRKKLKKSLYQFIKKFKIDFLIIENAVTIPMNLPLGLAISEVVAETAMPGIAHHHDFYWERQRFMVNAVQDYLSMAFPPDLPTLAHVVINTEARRQLSYRRGISSLMVPNVFDYSKDPPGIDSYNLDLRSALGIDDSDIFILQPTRVIARKGIEHAVELASRLGTKKVKLFISHQARDEGNDYYKRVMSYARQMDVNVILRPDVVSVERGRTPEGKKLYSLFDVYPHADFVTYPSTYEGFGNAFLEAVYFKKPILVNRYSIFQQDIEPVGFEVVVMDSYISDENVRQVKRIIKNKSEAKKSCDKNFEVAKKYFSYEILERKLKMILLNFGIVNGKPV